MRDSLRGIAGRVERLAKGVKLQACTGQHVVVGPVTEVWKDGPIPEWPTSDAPRFCTCGARLEYRRIIDQFFDAVGIS